MANQRDVAVIVGSLRKGSFSRMTALAVAELAPPTLKLQIVEIADLAMYNQDLEETPPQSWLTFREQVKPASALLFVTPEYNRSVPGCLKNAIDVGSRPYGKSVFEGKPGAVISVSPGNLAAFGANHHLRQSMVFLNVLMMQQPELYLGGASKLFDETGKLNSDPTRELLTKFAAAYERWIAKFA